jgi:hypothetical protein
VAQRLYFNSKIQWHSKQAQRREREGVKQVQTVVHLVHFFPSSSYLSKWISGVDFIKQFMPYGWNLRSAPILLKQIYSNLASCICTLRSTFCILSQIFGVLYALRPAPNFYEIHPRSQNSHQIFTWPLSQLKVNSFL